MLVTSRRILSWVTIDSTKLTGEQRLEELNNWLIVEKYKWKRDHE